MRSTTTRPKRSGSSPKTARAGASARSSSRARGGKPGPSGTATRSRTGTRASAPSGPATRPNPTDPAVFRRRRLVVLTLVLVLVVGAVLGVRAALGALAASDEMLPRVASTAPVPHPDPDAAPTRPPTEEELANPIDCRPAAVGITIEMASTVVEGATTAMPVTVTNAGQVPCLLDVGGAQILLTIYSGDDLVWTSQHCSKLGERRILLDVGAQDQTAFRWTGTRSASGCPAEQPVAKAGTYRAVVTLVSAGEAPHEIATVEKAFTVT